VLMILFPQDKPFGLEAGFCIGLRYHGTFSAGCGEGGCDVDDAWDCLVGVLDFEADRLEPKSAVLFEISSRSCSNSCLTDPLSWS